MGSQRAPSRAVLLNLDEALFETVEQHRVTRSVSRTEVIRDALRRQLQPSAAAAHSTRPEATGFVGSGSNGVSSLGRRISLYLCPAEAVSVNARSQGWRSAAAWCRAVIRRELGTGGPLLSEPELEEVRASVRELRRIGVNLNQLAHRMHSDDRFRFDVASVSLLHDLKVHVDGHVRALGQLIAARSR
jgi:hypothetical protein